MAEALPEVILAPELRDYLSTMAQLAFDAPANAP